MNERDQQRDEGFVRSEDTIHDTQIMIDTRPAETIDTIHLPFIHHSFAVYIESVNLQWSLSTSKYPSMLYLN